MRFLSSSLIHLPITFLLPRLKPAEFLLCTLIDRFDGLREFGYNVEATQNCNIDCGCCRLVEFKQLHSRHPKDGEIIAHKYLMNCLLEQPIHKEVHLIFPLQWTQMLKKHML